MTSKYKYIIAIVVVIIIVLLSIVMGQSAQEPPPLSQVQLPQSTNSNQWIKANAPAFTHPYGVVSDPAVLQDGKTLRMFYTCLNPHIDRTAICQNTSTDDGKTWKTVATAKSAEDPAGLVVKGGTGLWDEYLETAAIVKRDGTYYLFYSGYVKVKGVVAHKGKIGLAKSQDGITFVKVPQAVLLPTVDWYDNDAIYSPVVTVMPDNSFAMLYVGHSYCDTCGSNQGVRILGATSPDGIAWTKVTTPVLTGGTVSWTTDGVAEPDLATINGTFYLFITGLQGDARVIGIAKSNNVFGPYTVSATPIIKPGPSAYDSSLVLAPTVLIEGDLARVWYLAYSGDGSSGDGTYSIGYVQATVPFVE